MATGDRNALFARHVKSQLSSDSLQTSNESLSSEGWQLQAVFHLYQANFCKYLSLCFPVTVSETHIFSCNWTYSEMQQCKQDEWSTYTGIYTISDILLFQSL